MQKLCELKQTMNVKKVNARIRAKIIETIEELERLVKARGA